MTSVADITKATISVTDQADIDALNASLQGEYFGIAAYQAAIESGLLEDDVRPVAEKFQGDHKNHVQRIRKAIKDLGSKPTESKSWEEYAADFPPPALTSQADVLRYAADLEKSAAIGSVASVGDFNSSSLAKLAASIAGVEAMHWSVLLGALGEDPAPVSFIPGPDA